MSAQSPLRNEKDAKERVIQLVQRTKRVAGISGSARYQGSSNPIARCLNITVVESQLPADEGLYLERYPPTIVLDIGNVDPDRLNFTFFHEITHHLIKQDDDLLSFIHEIVSSQYFVVGPC